MVSDRYVLERSRIAIAFQVCIFISMAVILFQLLHPLLCSILLCLALIIRFLFTAHPIYIFEYLTDNDWSVQISTKNNHPAQIQRVQILKMVDHYFYMVIYVQSKHIKSFIIWKDQLPTQHWKRLRMRGELQ